MAKYKNADTTGLVISHWLRTGFTLNFLGAWERLHNPGFNVTEFGNIKMESTDAIKERIIPKVVTKSQIGFVYASEADLLNVAL